MSKVSHSVRFSSRFDRCCDSSSSRYALGGVHVRPASSGGAWLTATDGRVMAVAQSAESMAESETIVPMDLAAGATKSRAVSCTLNGRWENSKGKFGLPIEGRFPKCQDVLKGIDVNGTLLSINAQLLANLAAALTEVGDDQAVTLIIGPDRDKDGHVSRSVAVVGKLGIGMITPMPGPTRGAVEQFNTVRAAYIADCQALPPVVAAVAADVAANG